MHSLLQYILDKKEYPFESNIGRLIVLNKKPGVKPNINEPNFRPINAISLIAKLIDYEV